MPSNRPSALPSARPARRGRSSVRNRGEPPETSFGATSLRSDAHLPWKRSTAFWAEGARVSNLLASITLLQRRQDGRAARHGFGTRAILNGENPMVVAQQMGNL